MPATPSLQLPPLTRQSMNELVAKAKRVGINPGDYAKRLIEDGLAFQREAEESSFAEIMGAVRGASGRVSDAQVTKLVKTARADHHAGSRPKNAAAAFSSTCSTLLHRG